MILALVLATLSHQTQTIELFRGSKGVGNPSYWAVEDTYIDSRDAESNFGGGYTMLGGPGKTILIRFGDLNRQLGPNAHIVKAYLELTPSGGQQPTLRSASRVLAPWGEGPLTTLSSLFTKPVEGKPKPSVPRGAANWRQRLGGIASWQQAGATGASDVQRIETAKLGERDKVYAVEGIETAIQKMVDSPTDNYGLALNFESESEFFSSQSPSGRPKLILEVERTPAKAGPDLSVTLIEKTEDGKFVAHVKNVGSAPAPAFSYSWSLDGQIGGTTEGSQALAPGAETTFAYEHTVKATSPQRVAFQITPKASDICKANDSLEVLDTAIPAKIVLTEAAAKAIAEGTNSIGTHGVEDWAQSQARIWNEVYCKQSRYSFATNGVNSRIRIQSISIDKGEGIRVDSITNPAETAIPLMKSFAIAMGADEGAAMNVETGKVDLPGSTLRASVELYPGILGYGDTRYEGTIPSRMPLSYEPYFTPDLLSAILEPTDLLSASEVGAINERETKADWKAGDGFKHAPRAILLRALDLIGRPIANTELAFYQSEDGKIKNGAPTMILKTDASGTVLLPSKGSCGPFGEIVPGAGNGVFLIQAKSNGATETGWLKAWQIPDSFRRGNTSAAIIDVRLNLPAGPLDTATDLALDRIITDSAGSSATNLNALIDANDATEGNLPQEVGGWVEIDLGRDRTIADVSLLTTGKPFWNKFDIVAYSTGQKPADALTWARELDWSWSSHNRKDAGTGQTFVMSYRAPLQRVRYIRLINRSGGVGTLAGIRITPAVVGQQQ